MRVLVIGPESSGTRLLARIIESGAPTVHRSLPHGNVWLEPQHFDVTHRVVITREIDKTCQSAVAAGHAADYQDAGHRLARALQILHASVPPSESTRWVVYEELVAEPDTVVDSLSEFLGVHLAVPEDIVDGNAQWLDCDVPDAFQDSPEPAPPVDSSPDADTDSDGFGDASGKVAESEGAQVNDYEAPDTTADSPPDTPEDQATVHPEPKKSRRSR